jgi:hypothetical protein
MFGRLAFQELHCDEVLAADFVDVVNRADIRMVQSRSCTGLPLETLQSLAVFGEFFWKELQGYVAAELQVFGLIHHPHPASAQLPQDFVMRERLADHAMEPAFGESC